MIRINLLMLSLVVCSLLSFGCFVEAPQYEKFTPEAPPSERGLVSYSGYSSDSLQFEIPLAWNTLEGRRNLYALIPQVLAFGAEYIYTGVRLSAIDISEYAAPAKILIDANGNTKDDSLSNVQLIDSTQFEHGYTLRYSALHHKTDIQTYDIVIPLEGKGYLVRFMCDASKAIELPDLDQVRSSIEITLSTVELSYGSGWYVNDTSAALIYDSGNGWNSDLDEPTISLTVQDTFAIELNSTDPMEMNRTVKCEFLTQTITAKENICSGLITGNSGALDTIRVYSINPMTGVPGDTFLLAVDYEVSGPNTTLTIAESAVHPNARIKVTVRGYKLNQYNGLGQFALWSSQGDTLVLLEDLLARDTLLQDTSVTIDYIVPEGVDSITFFLEAQDIDALADTTTKTIAIEAHVFDTIRLAGITDRDTTQMVFPDSWTHSIVENGHQFKNSFYSGYNSSYNTEDVKSSCVYQTTMGSEYTYISSTYLSDVGARSESEITELVVVDSSNTQGLRRINYSGKVLERSFVFYDVIKEMSDWVHLIRCHGEERNKLALVEVVDSLVNSLEIEYPEIEVTFSDIIINNDTSLATPSFYRVNDTLSYVVTINDTLNGDLEVLCVMGDSTKAMVGDTCKGHITEVDDELMVKIIDPMGVEHEYSKYIYVRDSTFNAKFSSSTKDRVFVGELVTVWIDAYDLYDHSSFKRIYLTMDNIRNLFDRVGEDANLTHSLSRTYTVPDDVGLHQYIVEVTNDQDSVVLDTFDFEILP